MNQSFKRYKTVKGAKRAALKEAAEHKASFDIWCILIDSPTPRSPEVYQYFTLGSGHRTQPLADIAFMCRVKAESIKRVHEMVGTTEFRDAA